MLPSKSRVWLSLLACPAVLLAALAVQVRADPPSISYIFPAGGQRGTSLTFNVGGHYLHEQCPFEILGEGVAGSPTIRRAKQTVWFEGPMIPMPDSQRKEDYPKDQTGTVAIAADAPLGFRRWRVWTSQGATESMKFVVGDLPEVVEKEIDGNPIPMQVNLPITINGRIFPREDIDIWTFEARKGRSYTCEVMAARLGSPLDSRLEVLDPFGRQVAENTDAKGSDSFVRFRAETDGIYQVRIQDANFEGLQHYVYRLTITDGPYVDRVYPLGGQRGTVATFELAGQNVPAATKIQLPTEGHSFIHREKVEGRASNPVTIELGDLPEYEEDDKQSSAAVAGVTIPAVCNGRIKQPGEVDRWEVGGTKGETFEFDLRAARLGSPLDSVLTILNSEGKQLAQADDLGKGQTDSNLKFKFPGDGVYTVTVEDRFSSRGGPDFAYRLVIDNPVEEPGFELQLPADALTLNRGAEAKLKISATRNGGFSGEIQLRIDNLPAGVTVTNNVIAAKKNDTQLTFAATNEAKIQAVRLKIVATATMEDKSVECVVTKPTATFDDLEIDHLLLAISMPTPFKVTGIFDTKFAARGATFTRHYSIDRGGFEGPITISMADRQVRHLQGVTGPVIVVPPGKSEFDYSIHLPPWMEIGRTSRTCVMATGIVKDSDGREHKVSYTSHEQADQIILLVDPGQLALQCSTNSLVVAPGQQVDLPVQVGRGQGLDGTVTVELVVPEHVAGVTSQPITLNSNQDEGTLSVRFSSGPIGPFNMPLLIRATANPASGRYTAECKVEVVRTNNAAGE